MGSTKLLLAIAMIFVIGGSAAGYVMFAPSEESEQAPISLFEGEHEGEILDAHIDTFPSQSNPDLREPEDQATLGDIADPDAPADASAQVTPDDKLSEDAKSNGPGKVEPFKPATPSIGSVPDDVEVKSRISEEEARAKAAAEQKAREEWAEKARPHEIRGAAAGVYRAVHKRRPRQSRGNGKTPETKLEEAAEGINPPADQELQPGLYGEYYALYDEEPLRIMAARNDPTARTPTFTRVDTQVNFPNRASFGFQQPTTNFVVRWRGFIYVEEDTELELWLSNDIGGALVIDGQTVVLNDTFSWSVLTGTRVKLSAGYHQLGVEHIENYQSDDGNLNSVCQLLYVPEGETKPIPVPADWLFQPLELSDYAPRIGAVNPPAADIGDEITISGVNLIPRMITVGEVSDVNGEPGAWGLAISLTKDWQGRVDDWIELRTPLDENLGSVRITSITETSFTAIATSDQAPPTGTFAVIPWSSGEFFEGQTRVEVRIGGVSAEVLSSAQNAIRCVVPVGADTGEIEVRVGGMPSNRVDFIVTTQFGLVVSVWDLTGQAYDFVDPNTREPDFVVLEENPFPLTPDKFSQFAGKPIAVRVEGFVASAAAYESSDSTEEDGNSIRFENRFDFTLRNTKARISLENNWQEHDASPGQQAQEGIAEFSIGKATQPDWHAVVAEIVFDGTTSSSNTGIEVSTRAGIGIGEAVQGPSTVLLPESEIWTDELPLTERRFFKPAFIPPEAPILDKIDDADIEAPVGGEFPIWATRVEAGSSSENELRFLIDGEEAAYRIDDSVPESDRRKVQVLDMGKGERSYLFIRYLVTVPDLAGEGEIRARRGIVQSDPVQMNITNRGVVGYYYDFDEVLRTIPDMDAATPVMKRLDKGLRFENSADFDLPMPAERFSAEWYGSIRIPEGMSGEWTFHIQSDDGFRLTIDDTVVSEFPGLRPPRESSGKVTLGEGWHDLHVTFYENDVLENMVIWWVPPDSPEGFREFIPLKHLSTDRVRGVPDKQVVPPAVAQNG